jgi:hypothetical protein
MMEQVRASILQELAIDNLNIHFSSIIKRSEGPIVTACIIAGNGRKQTFGHLSAAGAVRLRSNHRLLAYKSKHLHDPKVDYFHVEFVDGNTHRSTPPFMIGDLSDTDQSLHYLMSRAALGNHPDLLRMEMRKFPTRVRKDVSLYQKWPTDDAMILAVLQLEAA